MGKFSCNREYTFANFDELVEDILTEFRDGAEIDIVIPYDYVNRFLSEFLSKGITAKLINYAIPEISDYNKDYIISLCHIDGESLFVESAYDENHEIYIGFSPFDTHISFISKDISMDLYQHIKDCGLNTVLYDFE